MIDWAPDASPLRALPARTTAYRDVVRSELLPPKPVFEPAELETLDAFVTAAAIKPEGMRPFDLSQHRHLIELYAERRDAPMRRVVVMKAAQMGLTIRLLNRALWWVADSNSMINTALLFPSRDSVLELSATRFRPMVRSSARMMELIKDVDKVDVIRVGRSNMRFRGTRSGISIDSFPADVLLFDEVRLMSLKAISRAQVRVSESTIRGPGDVRGIIELNSTAGFPGLDIHSYFERSTRGYWHTHCPDEHCPLHEAGIPLPLEFAENHTRVIGRMRDGRYYLRCPRCGARIRDAQDGHYHHQQPDAMWRGYQFSQLLKGEEYLNSMIMPELEAGDNPAEFYNARLGLPYEDRNAVPAGREVVLANIDPARLHRWPLEPLGFNAEWRAMGMDQRAGEKHIVVKTLLPDGRHRLDHVEVIEASGLHAVDIVVQRITEWGVKIFLGDGEPSYDLFVQIARRVEELGLPCEVWLQDYLDGVNDIVAWEDRRKEKSIRRTSGELKYEKRAKVDRYKALDWSLGLFQRRNNVLPIDLLERMQTRQIAGKRQPLSVGDEYVTHLGNLAKVRLPVTRIDKSTGESFEVVGEYRQAWRNLRLDPHFAHADLYANLGLKRMQGTGRIFGAGAKDITDHPKPEELGLPADLAPSVLERRLERAKAKVCGTCRFFDAVRSECKHQFFHGKRVIVAADHPSCSEGLWRRRRPGDDP